MARTARPVTGQRRRARTPDGEARGAILAATERLLAQRPFQELSVADIVEESGVSRASFYFYFATKPAVLAALAESVCNELVEIWQPWFDGEGAADAPDLRANFDATVSLWGDHRAILTATVDTWRHDPEVGAMWGTVLTYLVDQTRARIERERAAGRPAGEGDAAALAETLVWCTERLHYLGLSGIADALDDPERLVDALVLLWSRLLAP